MDILEKRALSGPTEERICLASIEPGSGVAVGEDLIEYFIGQRHHDHKKLMEGTDCDKDKIVNTPYILSPCLLFVRMTNA